MSASLFRNFEVIGNWLCRSPEISILLLSTIDPASDVPLCLFVSLSLQTSPIRLNIILISLDTYTYTSTMKLLFLISREDSLASFQLSNLKKKEVQLRSGSVKCHHKN